MPPIIRNNDNEEMYKKMMVTQLMSLYIPNNDMSNEYAEQAPSEPSIEPQLRRSTRKHHPS